MGNKNWAVLTRVFFTRKCMAVLPGGPQKLAVITMWPYHRGGRKAGVPLYVSFLDDLNKEIRANSVSLISGRNFQGLICWTWIKSTIYLFYLAFLANVRLRSRRRHFSFSFFGRKGNLSHSAPSVPITAESVSFIYKHTLHTSSVSMYHLSFAY